MYPLITLNYALYTLICINVFTKISSIASPTSIEIFPVFLIVVIVKAIEFWRVSAIASTGNLWSGKYYSYPKENVDYFHPRLLKPNSFYDVFRRSVATHAINSVFFLYKSRRLLWALYYATIKFMCYKIVPANLAGNNSKCSLINSF